jgi:hypothetical protein
MHIVQLDHFRSKHRVSKRGSPPCKKQEISHTARCLETVLFTYNNFSINSFINTTLSKHMTLIHMFTIYWHMIRCTNYEGNFK